MLIIGRNDDRRNFDAMYCGLMWSLGSGFSEDFEEDIGAVDNKGNAAEDIASEKDV